MIRNVMNIQERDRLGEAKEEISPFRIPGLT
jgi:hypothetical protein